MKRKIVNIDEAKCDGCGLCIPNCAECALQIIDGKARLVSDLFCDGLGACLGYCPQGAIIMEEREAEPYNERKVMDYIVKGGTNLILAHLKHLIEHNEKELLREAVDYLESININIPNELYSPKVNSPVECQSCNTIDYDHEEQPNEKQSSQLNHWPIQLHLINPIAVHFQDADVLLTADCCAYAMGNFHNEFLAGKSLAIACPKLDSGKEIYLKKLTAMIEEATINSLTVMIMEVPCCGGLLKLAQQAISLSGKNIPLKAVVVSIRGEVLMEQEL
jgi:ferredoxin